MFDAEDDDEMSVCRDEACVLDYVHQSHLFPLHQAEPSKGRPRRPAVAEPDVAKRPDPEGLREATMRVFRDTDWPLAFGEIYNAVINDYGTCSVRSLHRHVQRLSEEDGFILVLDLGLAYFAYIRHDSKYRNDPANLREHLLGKLSPRVRRRVPQTNANASA